MKHVHVECLPDETLIRQLGYSQKYITHHSGKSKVFKKVSQVKKELAMVDEDPGSAKTTYEKNLQLIKEEEGVKQYKDTSGNIVVVLKGKLEDWILATCKKNKIDISRFGLPANANELHGIINNRLANFEKLIVYLLETKNKAILTLQDCLK